MTIFSFASVACKEVRSRTEHHQNKHLLLLEAYRQKKEGLKHGDNVKKHFIECQACLDWLGTKVEEPAFLRAKNAAEYCCLRMYMAVEETESSDIGVSTEKVRFTLWRGEDPMWIVGPHLCSIFYCPWCGKQLPKSPFRPSFHKR